MSVFYFLPFIKCLRIRGINTISHYYINYKNLKKLIKQISSKQAELNDLAITNKETKSLIANFYFNLDRNIEKVDDFYNQQFFEYDRRLLKLISILDTSFDLEDTGVTQESHETSKISDYGFSTIGHSYLQKNGNQGLDNNNEDEIYEIYQILLNLRSNFRNLKWFNELNKRAIYKILKKLDKKIGTNEKLVYLNQKIMNLPFNFDSNILKNLNLINSYLNKLSTTFQHLSLESISKNSLSDSTKTTVNTTGNINELGSLISIDDSTKLSEILAQAFGSISSTPAKVLVGLLNKSASNCSYKCIDLILQNMESINDDSDISGRNFFHHHIISLGKQYSSSVNKLYDETNTRSFSFGEQDKFITPATPPDLNYRLIGAFGSDGINSNDSIDGLYYILENLPIHFRLELIKKDNYKRTPLHYASQYGLNNITTTILKFIKSWRLLSSSGNTNISIDDVSYYGDYENLTPLHLAILGEHPLTAKTLVDSNNDSADGDSIKDPVKLTCPNLLILAARLNSPKLLELLVSCNGIDIDYVDSETNETSLYRACRFHKTKAVEFLLAKGANTEIGENSFGWTPIFIAASEGFKDIVELLIQFGAKYDKVDESGWLPMEHACLRGHLDVANLLSISNKEIDNQNSVYLNHINNSSIDKLSDSSNSSSVGNMADKLYKEKTAPLQSQPIKSFGHRYLNNNESLILITLGSNDLRELQPAIDLNRVPISKAHKTELDTALSLVVSCNLCESTMVIDLPLDDNQANSIDTISFKCVNVNPLSAVIFFDIVPTYMYGENTNKKVLGRGVAMMGQVISNVGPNLRSLENVVTIPILECETLEVLGNLRFEPLVIRSFSHDNMIIGRNETYWKSLVSTRVIGHRGLGKNDYSRKSLQLGENTVESFIAAASLGASYVEFDVQLTKDNVPVIYHDFTVAESGVDVPMHSLTCEQFLELNNRNSTSFVKDQLKKSFDDDEILLRRQRSLSSQFNRSDEATKELISIFNERMKFTKTWKDKGYKGNSRGTSIASSFVTLVELFKKLPKNVGFNIECKYPMLDEAQQEDMGLIAPELNFYVDTILKVVYDNSDGRDIIFSSFHPEVCILLSLKQPSIPILFLTEAGTTPMYDIRASSLQTAIRFAKKWNLLGIVSAAKTLVQCPRLASVVKASGLVCVTYGVENNEPELAKLQMQSGVDAVIADSVLAVRKGLTKVGDGDSDSINTSSTNDSA